MEDVQSPRNKHSQVCLWRVYSPEKEEETVESQCHRKCNRDKILSGTLETIEEKSGRQFRRSQVWPLSMLSVTLGTKLLMEPSASTALAWESEDPTSTTKKSLNHP